VVTNFLRVSCSLLSIHVNVFKAKAFCYGCRGWSTLPGPQRPGTLNDANQTNESTVQEANRVTNATVILPFDVVEGTRTGVSSMGQNKSTRSTFAQQIQQHGGIRIPKFPHSSLELGFSLLYYSNSPGSVQCGGYVLFPSTIFIGVNYWSCIVEGFRAATDADHAPKGQDLTKQKPIRPFATVNLPGAIGRSGRYISRKFSFSSIGFHLGNIHNFTTWPHFSSFLLLLVHASCCLWDSELEHYLSTLFLAVLWMILVLSVMALATYYISVSSWDCRLRVLVFCP